MIDILTEGQTQNHLTLRPYSLTKSLRTQCLLVEDGEQTHFCADAFVTCTLLRFSFLHSSLLLYDTAYSLPLQTGFGTF